MSRSVITHIATALALSSSLPLWSWGPARSAPARSANAPTDSPSRAASSFPYNEEQGWYTKETYLLWHPQEDDVDWADRASVHLSDTGTQGNIRLKKPDFDWYSGIRLSIGRYLPKHDYWDVSLTTTYFYANTESSASFNVSTTSLQPTSAPIYADGLNKGKGTWRLNFFTFDLGLGREVAMTSKITAHPFMDLRTVLMYETDGARFASVSNGSYANAIKFKGFNDYWGIGPCVGSDFTFYLNESWSILGSLAGSVLMGGSKVQQTINGADNFKIFHHEYAIRGNLEGSLGIGWERWVRQNSVRIAPSFVFEAGQWYDMNQWIVLKTPIGPSTNPPTFFETDRRHGDLTLWGFNFNIQVDF